MLVRRIGTFFSIYFFLQAVAYPQTGMDCPDVVAGAEELKAYTVASVDLRTPFDSFFGGLKKTLHAAKNELPQKENTAYNSTSITAGSDIIRKAFGTDVEGFGLPVSLTVVMASIENCRLEGSTKKLNIVYRLYTTQIPFFLSRTFESDDVENKDPAAGAGLAKKQKFRLLPAAGYNRSAKLHGGAAFSIQNLGHVDRVAISGEGSAQMRRFEGDFGGSYTAEKPWLRQLEWTGAYSYSDLPGEQGRLKKNRGLAEVSVLVREMGDQGFFRAGFSAEGGNQASRFEPTDLPQGTLSRADYEAIKAFAGGTYRGVRHAFLASYGFQAGAAGSGFGAGYQKHILDLGYRGKWMLRSHLPVELDVRLTGGSINNKGNLPVTERFFGGNVEESFLYGKTWEFRSNPVIRSFSQNQLDRTGPGLPIGGENFVSLNLTFTTTVWGKPLIEPKIASEFDAKIDNYLGQFEDEVSRTHEAADPATFQALTMTSEFDRLWTAMSEIGNRFDAIEDEIAENVSDDDLDVFFDCTAIISNALRKEKKKIEAFQQTGSEQPKAGLAVLFTVETGGWVDQISACSANENFRPFLGLSVDESVARMKGAQTELLRPLAAIDREAAKRKAARDFQFPRRVINTFLHEINIVSVAPVLIFDAARIGPQPEGGPGFRYAIGGGVRLSLVDSAHFTIGYAANPNPKAWERRGALLVSLDVVDLFYR